MPMFGTKDIWSKVPTMTPYDPREAEKGLGPLIEAMGLPQDEAPPPGPQQRRGMFGGLAARMGGGGEKMPFSDRAMAALAILGDDYGAAAKIRGAHAERLREEAQRAALAQQADALNLSERERFLLEVDPESFGQMLRERLSPRVVGQGGAVFQDGEQAFYNPQVGVDGGFAYTQSPEGIEWGEQRPMSHSEETSRVLGQERLDALRERYEALNAQAEARIGLSRQREGRISGGGGGRSGGSAGPKLPPGFILD